ncbi:MAG: endoribonuclease YicC domain-containing protein [Leptospirales bacterium]
MRSKTLNSMTGFGEYISPPPIEGYRITAKSLNHRNLEIQTSLPREWDHLDMGIRRLATQEIQRGRLEITVSRIDQTGTRNGDWLQKAIEAYHDLLLLKETLGIDEPVTIDQVIMHISHERTPSYLAVDQKAGIAAVSHALDQLVKSRQNEGEALKEIIDSLAREIQESVAQIELKRPSASEKTRAHFLLKLKELTQDVQSQETDRRLEEEALFYLSKKDNEEEWQRLKIHLTRFRQDLLDAGPIGKSLDFLLQEMQREINTFITKETQQEIFQPAMSIRNTLTKLKEQIQNVE